MTVNSPFSEIDALDWAISWLSERLPESWKIGRSPVSGDWRDEATRDGVLKIAGPQSFTPLIVDARESFQPRDLVTLRAGPLRAALELQRVPLLVLAPWLSSRTQELLAEERINYLDLTGNALIKLDDPALYLSAQGLARNPRPVESGMAGLRGGKAGRLMRLLADVRPPYTVGELAVASGLTQGYVSRLLDTLDREALIERLPRGPVESVDVPALTRRWARSYDLFRSNDVATFVAAGGAAAGLERLAGRSADRAVVTGSFAAVRLAPIAAPSLLALYVEDRAAVADLMGLLPADDGANVVLLTPFDSVVWERTETWEGKRYAAPSQVSVDCLTGTGRMPSEGEALLEWMSANERSWRSESLPGRERGPGS